MSDRTRQNLGSFPVHFQALVLHFLDIWRNAKVKAHASCALEPKPFSTLQSRFEFSPFYMILVRVRIHALQFVPCATLISLAS